MGIYKLLTTPKGNPTTIVSPDDEQAIKSVFENVAKCYGNKKNNSLRVRLFKQSAEGNKKVLDIEFDNKVALKDPYSLSTKYPKSRS